MPYTLPTIDWPPRPLVCVTWIDAHKDQDEHAARDIPHEAAVCRVYGLLLKQDEAGVTLADEETWLRDNEVTYRGRTFIPAPFIVGEVRVVVPAVRPLRVRRKRRTAQTAVPGASDC